MAIGRDVYCDSRLIITTLESLYPDSELAPPTPADMGTRKLLQSWTDGSVFLNATKMMPYWTSNGALQNKGFLDDREKLMGRRMTAERMEANRPDGMQHLRQALDLLETTFLADGRTWVLGTDGITLADIDAVLAFAWMLEDPSMKGSLPKEFVNDNRFPRALSYVRRFMDEVRKKQVRALKPRILDGDAMRERVLRATSKHQPTKFIQDDPLRLEPEDEVRVFASDYGSSHKDRGAIVGLSLTDVVIRNAKGLHLHFPRWNFRINKLNSPSHPSSSALQAKSPLAKALNMRLMYNPFSPYTRKVYMLAHELGLASQITLEKVRVCPIPFPGWSVDNENVAAYNPMGKIPCLVTDEIPDGIFDSRTICDYLSALTGVNTKKDRQYWQLRTLHACADGIMDAILSIVYEVKIREPKGIQFPEWVEGQKVKMRRGLDRFETAAKEGFLNLPRPGVTATADEVAVVIATAATDYMPYLNVNWREGRPMLQKLMEAWSERDSFVETSPEKDWGLGMEADNKTAKI